MKCKTCNMDTSKCIGGPNLSECTNCWEVEHRLESYLQSSKGRDIVRKALEQAYKDKNILLVLEKVIKI